MLVCSISGDRADSLPEGRHDPGFLDVEQRRRGDDLPGAVQNAWPLDDRPQQSGAVLPVPTEIAPCPTTDVHFQTGGGGGR